MHDPLAVHVLKCARNLVNVSPDLLFWKAHFIFLSTFHYHLEIAFFGPLDGNEQLIQLVVYEPTQILHDVRVI